VKDDSARYVICNDLTKNHAGNITDISTRTPEQCKRANKILYLPFYQNEFHVQTIQLQ